MSLQDSNWKALGSTGSVSAYMNCVWLFASYAPNSLFFRVYAFSGLLDVPNITDPPTNTVQDPASLVVWSVFWGVSSGLAKRRFRRRTTPTAVNQPVAFRDRVAFDPSIIRLRTSHATRRLPTNSQIHTLPIADFC